MSDAIHPSADDRGAPWRRGRAVDALLCAIPLTLWAFAHYLTYKYAVDVPYWDAWEYADLVTGRRPLTWTAIWEQHNEHRIVWQTLFEVAWGRWMRWDQYLASFLPFVALGAAYTLLVYRAMRARPWLTLVQRVLLAGALSFALFTFKQYEVLFWDMMLCWGVLVLALVVFAEVFARYVDGEGGWRPTLLLAALVVVAALSTGQGLAVNVYVVVAGVVATAIGRRLPRGYWALAGFSAALAALYFVGYVKPAEHPPVTAAFGNPKLVVEYVTALLGSPFAWTPDGARRWGFIVVAIGAAAAGVLVWRSGRDGVWELAARRPLIPVSAILLAAITVGRAGFGAHQATAPRYVPFVLVLVVPLVLVGLDQARALGPAVVTGVLVVVLLVLVPVWYSGYRLALHEAWARRDALTRWAECARAYPDFASTCDGSALYPNQAILARRTRALRDRGLSLFADRP